MTQDNKNRSGATGNKGLLLAIAALVAALGVAFYMRPGSDLAQDAAPTEASPDRQEVVGAMPEAGPDTQEVAGPASDPGAEAPTRAEPEDAPARTAEQQQAQDTGAGSPAAAKRPYPSIDEVRLEADGVLVVAGRAAPGDTVGVLIDGTEVSSGVADGSGSFAAIALLDPIEDAKVLTLVARSDAGALVSLDEVILTPRLRTAEVAAAQTGGTEPAEPSGQPSDTVTLRPVEAPQTADTTTRPPEASTAAPDAAANIESGSLATVEPDPQMDAPARDPQAAGSDPSTAAQGADQLAVDDAARPVERAASRSPTSEPAILKSTEEGVSLVQPRLDTPNRIALDTIGYSDSGVVQLSGRASAEAREIRVYLDNKPVARLPLDASGSWRGDVPDVDTGVYTLRIDAVDAAGRVTSRVETPFRREAPEVLAAASAQDSGTVRAVTVQAGDTLWAIARERYGEGVLYVRVFEANRASIRDPDLIFPGQVFDLPGE